MDLLKENLGMFLKLDTSKNIAKDSDTGLRSILPHDLAREQAESALESEPEKL